MFLHLNHQKPDAYRYSLNFVVETYRFSNMLPAEERFNLTRQIRRAAISVHLNLAEGSSRHSLPERKRFYEISRGSISEVDAALDIASALEYCNSGDLASLGNAMIQCFKSLSGLINAIRRDEPLQ